MTLHALLLYAAVFAFLLDAFHARSPLVNLTAFGLALWALSGVL